MMKFCTLIPKEAKQATGVIEKSLRGKERLPYELKIGESLHGF